MLDPQRITVQYKKGGESVSIYLLAQLRAGYTCLDEEAIDVMGYISGNKTKTSVYDEWLRQTRRRNEKQGNQLARGEPQHLLNFLPLPHAQGAFLEICLSQETRVPVFKALFAN